MKLNKLSGMEFIWLALAIGSAGYGAVETLRQGIAASYPLFIIAFIGAVMLALRREMRRKEESKQDNGIS